MTKREKLIELRNKMLQDKSLPKFEGATRLVFGAGNPEAKIMFIGEGPGFYEDKEGIPFVGRAGALLNQLLQSIKLARENVFITNVVHYRPTNNRDPEPEEIAAFGEYLDKMIDIISPKAIVTLGRFSMGKFLPGVTISAVHGKKFEVNWNGRNIIVVPMYHPAAALRSTEITNRIKTDFLQLPDYIKDIDKPEIKQMELA